MLTATRPRDDGAISKLIAAGDALDGKTVAQPLLFRNGLSGNKLVFLVRYDNPQIEFAIVRADLVLDFLKHPDLSNDLIAMCGERKIPVVASGKKFQNTWPHTPLT